MANKYWIGGTGVWSDPNHWSLVSGGTADGGVPTVDDDVYFDANSFTAVGQKVTVSANANCNDIVWTNAQFNPTFVCYQKLNVYGTARFIEAMTVEFEGHMYLYSSSNFYGAGKSFGVVRLKGANIFNIFGDNTFTDLNVDAGATVVLEAESNQTVGQIQANGLPTNLINFISSEDGVPATITSNSYSINVKYCTLKDVNGSGVAEFNALRCVDNGNNSGWEFIDNTQIGRLAPATAQIAGLIQPVQVQKLDSIEYYADNVEASELNGHLKINGQDITIYTPPQVEPLEIPTAEEIYLITTNFNNNLDENVATVQQLAEAVDSLSLGATEVSDSIVTITDTNNHFVATNLDGVLDELFTSVVDGKGLIATAINDMNGDANGSDDFSTLSNAIRDIQSGGSLTQITKLNVVAPYTKEIVLSGNKPIESLCTTALEFLQDTGVTQYQADFNNGDASNFNYDSEFIVFDGKMNVKNVFIEPMTNLGSIGDGNLYEGQDINANDYQQVGAVNVNNFSVKKVVAPMPQIVTATGDINLSNIESIDNILWTTATSGTGKSLLVISFDSGTTYKAFNGTDWVVVDTTNIADFGSKGMNKSVTEALTKAQLEAYRDGRTTMRFAYYLEEKTTNDVADNDQIKLFVTLPGYSILCSPAKYTMSYDTNTQTITYLFNTNGTYTINYAG